MTASDVSKPPGSTPRPSIPAELTPPTQPSASTVQASPADAMSFDAFGKIRLLLALVVVVAVVGLTALSTAGGGTPTARAIFRVVLIVLIAGCGGLLLWLRERTRLTTTTFGIIGVLCLFGLVGMLLFWGLYSPAGALVTIALYIFASSVSFRLAFSLYAGAFIIHWSLWIALLTGALDDPGVINSAHLPLMDRIMSFIVPQVVYLATFVSARASRKRTLESMKELETAVRGVAVRDALLNEAVRDLERARGGAGLFTGQRVGTYALGHVIARGGMGEVYRGVDTTTGEDVAVKLLHRKDLGDPNILERFLREAKIAASLDSPHLTKLLQVSGANDEIPFIAMELLEGEDLRAHLRRHAQMSLPDVVALIEQLALGLSEAHRAGVVHRDIKPSNVFRTGTEDEPLWKILDFGVSREVSAGGTLTDGGIVGTPGYMAPEQAVGKAVDHRADVYGLAVVAYRCITGQPPFAGEPAFILFATMKEMPVRPTALRTVKTHVELVLALGLAKDPAERFDDALSFAHALRDATRGVIAPSLQDRAEAILKNIPWGEPDES